MLMTRHKPVTIGEMISEEFLAPLNLNREQLVDAMGIGHETVHALCDNHRPVDVGTALISAKVFGNSAKFWLNTQQRNDLWQALHSLNCVERIKQAKPLVSVTGQDLQDIGYTAHSIS